MEAYRLAVRLVILALDSEDSKYGAAEKILKGTRSGIVSLMVVMALVVGMVAAGSAAAVV